jgi:integrase
MARPVRIRVDRALNITIGFSRFSDIAPKTDAGERVIPLNQSALAVLVRLRKQAELLGETRPEHYVFSACENGKIDPTKPMKSWRSAWRSLRKKAGLNGLRFHDLRHQAITEMCEKGLPDMTIMQIAGHVSPEMLKHYSHIRTQAKREAVGLLETPLPDNLTKTAAQCVEPQAVNLSCELNSLSQNTSQSRLRNGALSSKLLIPQICARSSVG